jgi:transcriptional regulator with XRE-family HTH domain
MSSKRANAVDNLVAARIRAYRRQCGISQAALAEGLGLTFQQIQKYEKGTNRIGAGRLFQLAGILKVPLQSLFPKSDSADIGAELTAEQQQRDFAESAETLRLLRAFSHISDTKQRKRIIDLIEEIGKEA